MDLKRILFFKLAFRWHVKLETIKRHHKYEIEYKPPKREVLEDENDLTRPIKVFPNGKPFPLLLKRKPLVSRQPRLPTITEGEVLSEQNWLSYEIKVRHKGF